MVLMRRKDKRRGNEESELEVASDSTIAANKGFRSLAGARSGRFAADMRIAVGGYGRPDKTWAIDHPWHQTEDTNVFRSICARDHMEEGEIVKQQLQDKPAGQGCSRAALRKRKKKQQKEQNLSTQGSIQETKNNPTISTPPTATATKATVSTAIPVPTEKKAKGTKVSSTTKPTIEKKNKRKRSNKQNDPEKSINNEEYIFSMEDDDKTRANITKLSKESREILALKYESTSTTGKSIVTDSGLQILDKRVGKGKLPEVGDMLTLKYKGRLGERGLIFGKGILTPIFGITPVISGWEEGIATMRSGGMRTLTIPPELAYGSLGKDDKIPPNATLYFEIELVRIGKRKRHTIAADEMPLPRAFQRKRLASTKVKAVNKTPSTNSSQSTKIGKTSLNVSEVGTTQKNRKRRKLRKREHE